MKNKILCAIVSGVVLALSVVGTAYAVQQQYATIGRNTWNEKFSAIQTYFGAIQPEIYDGVEIYRISGERLVDYLIRRKAINEDDPLVSLMKKAYELQKALDGAPQNTISYYLPIDDAKKIYEASLNELFDVQLTKDSNEMKLFQDALFEVAGNPHGAKRLLSLIFLKKISEFPDSPYYGKFNKKIRIKIAASPHETRVTSEGKIEGINAFHPKDCHGDRDPKPPHNVVHPCDGWKIALTLSDVDKTRQSRVGRTIRDADASATNHGNVAAVTATDQEVVAGIFAHELTHLYHDLLFDLMPRGKMVILDDKVKNAPIVDRIKKNLFPTLDPLFVSALADQITPVITGFGESFIKNLETLVTKIETMRKSGALLTPIEEEMAYECMKDCIKAKNLPASDPNMWAQITARIIAIYLSASRNYWTDEEEMLTIYGAVAEKNTKGEFSFIVDRENHNSFLKRSRLHSNRFSHHSKPFDAQQEIEPSNEFRHVLDSLTLKEEALSDAQLKYDYLHNAFKIAFGDWMNKILEEGKGSANGLLVSAIGLAPTTESIVSKWQKDCRVLDDLKSAGDVVDRAHVESEGGYKLPAVVTPPEPTQPIAPPLLAGPSTQTPQPQIHQLRRLPEPSAPAANPLRLQPATPVGPTAQPPRFATGHAQPVPGHPLPPLPQQRFLNAVDNGDIGKVNEFLRSPHKDTLLDEILAHPEVLATHLGLDDAIAIGKYTTMRTLSSARYSDGNSLLHKAISQKCPFDKIKALVECFATCHAINARDKSGATPLFLVFRENLSIDETFGLEKWSADKWCHDVIKLLLEGRADWNAVSTNEGMTPLKVVRSSKGGVVLKGDITNKIGIKMMNREPSAEIFNYFLLYKDLFDIKGSDGHNLLGLAKENNYPNIAKFLEDNGAK